MTRGSFGIFLSVMFVTATIPGFDQWEFGQYSFPATVESADFRGAAWNPGSVKIETQTKSQKKRRGRRRTKKYSTDLNALRAQFNKDKGKVRLVLLLSPT